jgi:hypothetical protein
MTITNIFTGRILASVPALVASWLLITAAIGPVVPLA